MKYTILPNTNIKVSKPLENALKSCGTFYYMFLLFPHSFYTKKARGSPRARPLVALILIVKLQNLVFVGFIVLHDLQMESFRKCVEIL